MGFGTTTTVQRARPRVWLWPDGRNAARIELSPYVVGFSYTKAIHQPVGNWQLSLAPSQGENVWGKARGPAHLGRLADILRTVRPNAVVSIGFDEPGGIVAGLVDSVRDVRRMGGPSAGASVTLSGSDFGKVLAVDHIVHASLSVQESAAFFAAVQAVVGPDHALLQALPGVWGPTDRDAVPTFIQQPIQAVVDWLLKTGPSFRVPLLSNLGGSGLPGEYIRTDGSITSWNDGRISSEAPHTYQGNLWGFLRSLLDEDFYEIFLDCEPNGFELPDIRLTIRPKPFDERAIQPLPVIDPNGLTWEDLKTRLDAKKDWEIPIHEVCGDVELENSDADVFSYYLVTSEHELIGNPDGLKEGLFYPAVDLFALTRAGLRSYEGRLSIMSSDIAAKQRGEVDYDTEVGAEVRNFRNRLVNWYRLSEYFETGSITVVGRDRYRIGDPVLLPWRMPMRGDRPGVRYYCIGTTHSWSLGRPYTTTLRLTRGHNSSVIERANLEIGLAGAQFGNPSMIAETS